MARSKRLPLSRESVLGLQKELQEKMALLGHLHTLMGEFEMEAVFADFIPPVKAGLWNIGELCEDARRAVRRTEAAPADQPVNWGDYVPPQKKAAKPVPELPESGKKPRASR